MGRVCRRLLISGKVQGVSFRQSTLKEAQRFESITGYVRNLPSGQVEVMLCGEIRDVESLTEWCRHGPPHAQVKVLDSQDLDDLKEFSKFLILP